MKIKTAYFVLGLLCYGTANAGLELAPSHLVSNEPWITENIDGEAVCSAGLLKIVVGDRGVGFSGMGLPLLEKAKLVIDQKQVFEVEPDLIYGTSATYLLSNKTQVKNAILQATTVELITRNCESKPLGIFSLHGCSKTFSWSFQRPLEVCALAK